MKKNILYIIAASFFIVTSCNKFGDMNIDPEAASEEQMDYRMLFTNVLQHAYGTEYEAWRNGLIYISTMIQHTASVESNWNGDKYTYDPAYNSAFWDKIFPNGIRDAVILLDEWKDNEAFQTEYQMVRILRAFLFHRMTDLYGDVPYSEAGLGYIDRNGYPKYDTQEVIYKDMLKELQEATAALEGKKSSIGKADILYNGDVVKWQKFAYSLMLRLGMRLSKVDEAEAKKWVNEAIQGGLFANNAESAIITHKGAVTANNSGEPFGKIYVHEDPNAYRMSEHFINLLKDTEDPRLRFLATVVEDPTVKLDNEAWSFGDTTVAKQIGMPNGYDKTTNGPSNIKNHPLFPDTISNYSVVNRYTYARIDAPTFLLTHAENQLLLAEAAHRGWINGSADAYYQAGVTAAMKQFEQFGISVIPDEEIAKYLQRHPFQADKALEQINTQYYINTFSDEYESFSNWRRSGYPKLTPVNYIGNVTNGTIPRRFTYPTTESTVNSKNYQEAVARLSNGDQMTSRVCWDVEKYISLIRIKTNPEDKSFSGFVSLTHS